MARVYFHYSNSEGVCVDQRGTAVGNLAEVRDHAARVVQSLITVQGPEDWRDWTLHVSDDLNDEIFVLPFSSDARQAALRVAMLVMQPLLRTPDRDRDPLAPAGRPCPQPLPPRAALHARPRPEMARQARGAQSVDL